MSAAAVRCRVPAGFVPVDLAARDETYARELLAAGACYAAVFVLPPERAGYFVITEPAGPPPDLDALAGCLAADPDAGARSVELPCGRAVACVEYARVAAAPAAAAPVDVVQEHAVAIHPATGQAVTFTLGVRDTRRRPEYADLFDEILRTVSFSGS
ncbi:hypothetical protein ACFHW0_25945 [Micromonospora sp. LOL_025]|uniref:hypothetical protein n=1 Tax=Micromonospora sp. LOL_025 TaxID=3345413 RepID=UPI003A8A5169